MTVPLVFIHGVGLDRHLWDSTIASLAPGREVITYDLVGHGAGPHRAGPYSLSMFVEQLIELIDGRPRVDVCGFSLGALIAQAFAVRHPSRLARLILLGSVFQRTDAERQAIRGRVAHVRAGGYADTVAVAIERWFSDTFRAAHPEVVDWVRRTMDRNDVRAYADAYAVFAAGDTELAPFVETIAAPTLALAGSDDPRSTPAMAQALAARVSDGHHAVVAGTRHCFMLERPDEVARLIDQFLDIGNERRDP